MLWTPSLHPLRPSRSAVCLAEVTNEYFDAPTPWLCCDVDASWGGGGQTHRKARRFGQLVMRHTWLVLQRLRSAAGIPET